MALTRNTYQRNSSWNAPYTFSGKEKDAETGYGYFGARYYDSGLSIWLSVDPMSDKYPSMSPYNYCANNPVMLVDPDGMEIDDPQYSVIINTTQTKTLSVIQTPTHSSVTELSSKTTVTTTTGEGGLVNFDYTYTTDCKGIKILADGSIQLLNGSIRIPFGTHTSPFDGGGFSIDGVNVDFGSKINGPSSNYFYFSITLNTFESSSTSTQQAMGYNFEMSPQVFIGCVALVGACVFSPQLIPIIAGTVVLAPK